MIPLHIAAPTTPAEFRKLAQAIRTEYALRPPAAAETTVTFAAGAFRVTARNDTLAVEDLAVRLQKGPQCNTVAALWRREGQHRSAPYDWQNTRAYTRKQFMSLCARADPSCAETDLDY